MPMKSGMKQMDERWVRGAAQARNVMEEVMSTTGLAVFDKTLQTTHIWLDEISEAIGPDRQRSYHALRAVLFTLRDRLSVEEAFHMSAQLPMLVRGIFWDGYRPSGKPERYRSLAEFLEHVESRIGDIDPEEATRAVFKVLDRHLAGGELEDVRQSLPAEVQALFP